MVHVCEANVLVVSIMHFVNGLDGWRTSGFLFCCEHLYGCRFLRQMYWTFCCASKEGEIVVYHLTWIFCIQDDTISVSKKVYDTGLSIWGGRCNAGPQVFSGSPNEFKLAIAGSWDATPTLTRCTPALVSYQIGQRFMYRPKNEYMYCSHVLRQFPYKWRIKAIMSIQGCTI
jgi:hypothetical protein